MSYSGQSYGRQKSSPARAGRSLAPMPSRAGRRRKGSGSIRRRGDYSWELRISLDGERYAETFKGSEKQAKDRLDEIKQAFREKRLDKLSGRVYFGDYAEAWLR